MTQPIKNYNMRLLLPVNTFSNNSGMLFLREIVVEISYPLCYSKSTKEEQPPTRWVDQMLE